MTRVLFCLVCVVLLSHAAHAAEAFNMRLGLWCAVTPASGADRGCQYQADEKVLAVALTQTGAQTWEGKVEAQYSCRIPIDADDCLAAPSGENALVTGTVRITMDTVFGYKRYILNPSVATTEGAASSPVMMGTGDNGQFFMTVITGPKQKYGAWLVEPDLMMRPIAADGNTEIAPHL